MDIKINPETGQPCVLNQSTGELTPIIINAFTKKIKNGFTGGWLAMSQTSLEHIVTNKDLKLTDYRALLLIASVVDYENFVVVPQVELAQKLGISKGTLGSSMKKLVDTGILIKGPKWGRNITYRLNPQVGWKGTAKNHLDAMNEIAEKAREDATESSHLKVVK